MNWKWEVLTQISALSMKMSEKQAFQPILELSRDLLGKPRRFRGQGRPSGLRTVASGALSFTVKSHRQLTYQTSLLGSLRFSSPSEEHTFQISLPDDFRTLVWVHTSWRCAVKNERFGNMFLLGTSLFRKHVPYGNEYLPKTCFFRKRIPSDNTLEMETRSFRK